MGFDGWLGRTNVLSGQRTRKLKKLAGAFYSIDGGHQMMVQLSLFYTRLVIIREKQVRCWVLWSGEILSEVSHNV